MEERNGYHGLNISGGPRRQNDQKGMSRLIKLILAGCIVTILVLVAILFPKIVTIENHLDDDNAVTEINDNTCLFCDEKKLDRLKKYFESKEKDIDDISQQKSSISWSTYNSNPSEYAGRRVHLKQSDFHHGTLRIRSSGYFFLTENISFKPNADYDFMPKPSQADYASESTYKLGFFAAITVEADNVVIDLNHYILEQSKEHALQQRFFMLIELNNQPFLTKEGPFDFGSNPVFVKNVIIKDGTLGPTAHHGIHGNGGRHLLVKDVKIVDREVSGISLNGFVDTIVERVTVSGTRFTPVRGRYTQARALLQFVAAALTFSAGANPVEESDLIANRDVLKGLMDEVYEDIITNDIGTINCTLHPDACDLFDNPSRLPDGGTVYGMLFNSLGVAVLGFGVGTLQDGVEEYAGDIFILNCVIEDTFSHPIEVNSLFNINTQTFQHGPAGDVVDVISAANIFTSAYDGTPLTDVQLSLRKLVTLLPTFAQHPFQRMSIDDALIDWYDGTKTLNDLLASGDYTLPRNADAQAHVIKGPIGLRIERVNVGCIKGLNVRNVENFAPPCNTGPLPGESDPVMCPSFDDGTGHPAQGKHTCCQRSDARGVSIVESKYIRLLSAVVESIISHYAWSRGIDVFVDSNDVSVVDAAVSNILAAPTCSYYDSVCCSDRWSSPKGPQAIGVSWDLSLETDMCVDKVKVYHVGNNCSLNLFDFAHLVQDDEEAQ